MIAGRNWETAAVSSVKHDPVTGATANSVRRLTGFSRA
jgi:hypothetical protein